MFYSLDELCRIRWGLSYQEKSNQLIAESGADRKDHWAVKKVEKGLDAGLLDIRDELERSENGHSVGALPVPW